MHVESWYVITYLCHSASRFSKVEVKVWASCQIRKSAGCACAGNAGNVFPGILDIVVNTANIHMNSPVKGLNGSFYYFLIM